MKQRYTKRLWVLPLIAAAIGLALLLQGCNKVPTQPPSSTVITGTGRLQVSPTDYPDAYYFKSGSTGYGKLELWWMSSGSPDIVQLRSANGIKMGSGITAPEGNYPTDITLDSSPLAQSFFLKTDAAPHYARIQITGRSDASGVTTIDFNWWLQTEAGNRNLQ